MDRSGPLKIQLRSKKKEVKKKQEERDGLARLSVPLTGEQTQVCKQQSTAG